MSNVTIRPLDKTHNLGAFDCGVDKITNYLKHTAWKEHKNYKIRVFVASDESNIALGYYSLTYIVWAQENISELVVKKFDEKV